jgi:Mg-chelatase subunit ChlD
MLRGLALPGGILECEGTLAWLPSGLALVVVAGAVGAAVMRRGGVRGLVSAFCLGLSALALAFAAGQPVRVRSEVPLTAAGHVVALVDLSDSVWREEALALAALDQLADRAGDIARDLAGAGWTGEFLGFADGVVPTGAVLPLRRLPELIRALPSLPGQEGSRVDAGLRAALDRIRDAGGRGAVLLLSDGRFRPELPDALLDRAAAAGVAVSVLPAGSRVPARGLVAADIGPEQQIGHEAIIRGTVLGGGVLQAEDSAGQAEVKVPEAVTLQPVRLTTRFPSRGVHHVRLRYHGIGGPGQERVLYTLVRGPARVLSFGPARWLEELDPTRFVRVAGDPANPPEPGEFDLVVIDGMSPDDFQTGYDDKLVAVANRTGILLVNGPLRGTAEAPQVIGDWNDSALSTVLPVDSDPREFVQSPPGRDIVILIDTSGSMSGSFGLAKAVARAVIDQLRPQDTLAILPFADDTGAVFARQPATAATLAQARAFVDRLMIGGGTDPNSTLRAAGAMRTNYCAFFFISDGGFDAPATSPQCFTTAVSTEGRAFPSGVAAWGQEILLMGSVSGIRLEYFDPELRDAYWRLGALRPVPSEVRAPLTGLSLQGLAIAYPRIDAQVISLHPNPPPDPVLAIRRDAAVAGAGTAVFLSDLPTSASAADVAEVLTALLGWSRPDRFDLRVRQEGDRLTLAVLALSGDGVAEALPASLSGFLRLQGQGDQPLAFRAVGAPGRFEAGVTLRLDADPGHGELILIEPGGAAQVIPISVPGRRAGLSRAGHGEALDFGIDGATLERIARRTGGVDLSVQAPTFGLSSPPPMRDRLHPWAIVLGLFLLAASLWTKRRSN